jgi:hydroxymethylglutaryl-CoA lyase
LFVLLHVKPSAMPVTPIKIIECPRDAMQGIPDFIDTNTKASYINKLLKVGFDTIDFGSFVSPKAIPQMRDTAEVLSKLELGSSMSHLLAIIANARGAEEAVSFEQIKYLGYPFSISETFQLRNTNATIQESLVRVEEIQNICAKHNKKSVIYLSMGFGNPYGDPWSVDIAQQWVDKLADLDVKIMALSDTIGVATPESILYLFKHLIPPYPDVEFGAHLHTQPHNWLPKIEAAYAGGCRRFDVAVKGYGGCPMAKDELTGNMPSENVIQYFEEVGVELGLDKHAFDEAMQYSSKVFL